MFELLTERLRLREWMPDDGAALLPTGQDAAVMQFLGPLQDRAAIDQLIAGQVSNHALFGYCFWPLERRSDGALIGYCGLSPAPVGTPVEGRVEIGWRLGHAAWGHGYAYEAAAACLSWGFACLPACAPASASRPDPQRAVEIVAMTVPANARSWGLMERLGMTRRPALDYDHPRLAAGDPLRGHIVYAIDETMWQARNG